MKSSRLIVWLLVAACIAIDLAMIGELQIRRNEWPEPGGVIGLGLAFSQVALIALWAVWGRNKVLVRGVGTLLGVWAVSCLAAYSSSGSLRGGGIWFGVLMFYCSISLVPFVMARFLRYELANQSVAHRPPSNSQLSASQFTIGGILSLMTAIGIALAVVRFAEFPTGQVMETVAFFTLLAVTVCVILLLALFFPHIGAAVCATVLLCPVAGVLLSLTGLAPGEGTLELVLMVCVQGAAILAASVALRSAGYRLRRADASQAMASESMDASALESEGPGDEL